LENTPPNDFPATRFQFEAAVDEDGAQENRAICYEIDHGDGGVFSIPHRHTPLLVARKSIKDRTFFLHIFIFYIY
jgi:hypothetical protein